MGVEQYSDVHSRQSGGSGGGSKGNREPGGAGAAEGKKPRASAKDLRKLVEVPVRMEENFGKKTFCR
ncbi:hypothetical protein R70723_25410 [Paenibacillus sp. FSL R7-0273]|nr:hypothetical protein R70723_25410 [Paenibacillus sp. FSL R7-0273]OMF91247.1 hypothetical protein BK144_16105 [Paenibacillus sp. FSL R7-0273]